MKKTFIALIALAALTGCSKAELETPSTPELPDLAAPIMLSAGIEANTTVESRAAVAGTTFPATTNDVFRLTAYSGAAAPTNNYETTYFDDQKVNSGASSRIALNTAQYYPADGAKKLFFYAYAPSATTSVTAGSGTTAPIANYTIDGQQDIMAAQVITGIAKVSAGVSQPQPDLAFTHKLKQVQFVVKRDVTFEDNVNVTSIKVKSVKNSAKLDIITGDLTFDDTVTGDLSAYEDVTGLLITTIDTPIPGSVMFESGTTFTIDVVAGGVTYSGISVILTGTDAGNAGVSHKVTLTFKRNSVVSTASITEWTTPENTDLDIY